MIPKSKKSKNQSVHNDLQGSSLLLSLNPTIKLPTLILAHSVKVHGVPWYSVNTLLTQVLEHLVSLVWILFLQITEWFISSLIQILIQLS